MNLFRGSRAERIDEPLIPPGDGILAKRYTRRAYLGLAGMECVIAGAAAAVAYAIPEKDHPVVKYGVAVESAATLAAAVWMVFHEMRTVESAIDKRVKLFMKNPTPPRIVYSRKEE